MAVEGNRRLLEVNRRRWMTDGGWRVTDGRGGGGFRAGGNMNLQILAQQNLCHFLKMSEQMIYGSQ